MMMMTPMSNFEETLSNMLKRQLLLGGARMDFSCSRTLQHMEIGAGLLPVHHRCTLQLPSTSNAAFRGETAETLVRGRSVSPLEGTSLGDPFRYHSRSGWLFQDAIQR